MGMRTNIHTPRPNVLYLGCSWGLGVRRKTRSMCTNYDEVIQFQLAIHSDTEILLWKFERDGDKRVTKVGWLGNEVGRVIGSRTRSLSAGYDRSECC